MLAQRLVHFSPTLYDVCDLQRRGVLRPDKPVQRVTFTEVTQKAVTEALQHPRQVRGWWKRDIHAACLRGRRVQCVQTACTVRVPIPLTTRAFTHAPPPPQPTH
jgi:hypothetical protein